MIGYLAEEVWTILAELNEAIDGACPRDQHDIRRADGSTRLERFTDEESPVLIALPDEAFEHVEWKQAKVGRGYHLTVEHQHYSVPWRLTGNCESAADKNPGQRFRRPADHGRTCPQARP